MVNTCLHSGFSGFPSFFVPGFLQMKGRLVLHGLSSQRASCTEQSIHVYKGTTLTPSKGPSMSGNYLNVYRLLTGPHMETQSSWVLRKLLGSNGCQKVKITGVWSVHWKSICMSVSWSPIHNCSRSKDRKRTQLG